MSGTQGDKFGIMQHGYGMQRKQKHSSVVSHIVEARAPSPRRRKLKTKLGDSLLGGDGEGWIGYVGLCFFVVTDPDAAGPQSTLF